MEQYLQSLPFFVFAASIGILANFIFVTNAGGFTRMRIVREVFGGFWIATAGFVLLDQLTSLTDPVLFVITTFVAFVNSRIISFVGKDLMEYLAKGIGRLIRNLADRVKKDEPFEDFEEPDNPRL